VHRHAQRAYFRALDRGSQNRMAVCAYRYNPGARVGVNRLGDKAQKDREYAKPVPQLQGREEGCRGLRVEALLSHGSASMTHSRPFWTQGGLITVAPLYVQNCSPFAAPRDDGPTRKWSAVGDRVIPSRFSHDVPRFLSSRRPTYLACRRYSRQCISRIRTAPDLRPDTAALAYLLRPVPRLWAATGFRQVHKRAFHNVAKNFLAFCSNLVERANVDICTLPV